MGDQQAIIAIDSDKSGDLYTICNVQGVVWMRKSRDYHDVLSILKYDHVEKTAIIKLKSGDIIDIELANISMLNLQHIYEDASRHIMHQFINLAFCIKHGVLKITWPYIPPLTNKIMQNISAVDVTNKYSNGIKIQFKDGRVEDFNVIYDTCTYLVAESGERYDLTIDHNNVYCQDGKMWPVKIQSVEQVPQAVVVNTHDFRKYEFKYKTHSYDLFSPDAKLYRRGKYLIYVCPNNVVLTYEEPIYIIPRELEYMDLGNFNTESEISHYVDENKKILKFTHVMKYFMQMFKYRDIYHTDYGNLMLSHNSNFPLAHVLILYVKRISKNVSNFIIDNKYTIFAEIATDIKHMEADGDFGIYKLIITTRSGEMRRCCFVKTLSEYVLVFENGDVAPIAPEIGATYYSQNGPYITLDPGAYIRITQDLYSINSNLVYFNKAPELTEIRESFGDYLGFANNEPFIGHILINRAPIKAKPALN